MPIYTFEDYFSILTELIREDRIVPFACYILLPANKRVVKLVTAGEPFDKRIIAKLQQFKFDQIYVRNEDREKYELFLREFFASDEGKVCVQDLQEKYKDTGVPGLPDDLSKEFGLVSIKGTTDHTQDEAIQVKGAAENPIGDETTVKGITDKVEDSLSRVKGSTGEKLDPSKITVKNVTDSVKEENIKVEGGKAEVDLSKTKVSGGKTDALNEDRIKVSGERADNQNEEQIKVSGEKADALNEEKIKLSGEKAATRNEEKIKVSGTSNESDKSTTQVSGSNVEPAKGGDIRIASSPAPAEDKSTTTFKTSIPLEMKSAIQSENRLTIQLLQREQERKQQLQLLKSKWDAFQNTLPDKLAAREVFLLMQDLDSQQAGIDAAGNSLRNVSEELCEIVKVTPQKLAATEAKGGTSTGSASEGTLQLPPSSGENATPEALKAENAQLRKQLTSAKTLLDSTGDKLTSLRNYVDSSGVHIEALEKEVKLLKEQTNAAQSRAQTAEGTIIGLEETLAGSQRMTTKTKKELEKKDELLQLMQDKIQYLEKELKFFKEKYLSFDPNLIDKVKDRTQLPISDETVSLLLQKDKLIEGVNARYDAKDREAQEIDKTSQRLKSIAEDANLLKKRMSQKFEVLESEKEMKRLELDQVGRKFITSANLLEVARKTIARLSVQTEELKKERVEFMNKTSNSAKETKEVQSNTNKLAAHVQAEIQRNEKLQETLETFKTKNRELLTEVSDLKKKIRDLEAEVRKARTKAA